MPQRCAGERSALVVAGRGAQQAVPKVRWVCARMGKTHAWNSVHSRARCRQHGIELGVTVTQTIKSCYTLLGTLWQKPIHSGVSLFWRVDFLFRAERVEGGHPWALTYVCRPPFCTCAPVGIMDIMVGMDVAVSVSCASSPCAFGVGHARNHRVICHNRGRQSVYKVRRHCSL